MTTIEWIIAAYLAIGAARPIVKALANSGSMLDDPETQLFASLFGSASTGLVIALAVTIASLFSAILWLPQILVRALGRPNAKH